MKVTYDLKTDTIVMVLREGAAIEESDEVGQGIVHDLDASGNVVSIEILDASRRLTEADRVEFNLVR
ncbi:MAG TPA: DUF2283 domain-containing protein [Planctomycetota bacterium]|jgi:uncharacterized protein YuzE|nr:DUF2283 domain-containing protein [Planctomycetota bacterium]